MKTEVIKIDRNAPDMDALCLAGELIRQGKLVAFPTETVYGLGGNALDAKAAQKIYEAKGRPSDNPLIVHIADLGHLEAIVKELPTSAQILAKAFWPGPMTLILEKQDVVPDGTTGGLSTVAVRMPEDPIALELIRQGGGYIAAPSANLSGRPSPTTAEHVYEDLKGRIPLILDGGAVPIGLESTIIDLTEEEPVILRPGYISLEMLEALLGRVRMDPGLIAADSSIRPKAPGMKYRHYAPRAELTLVEGSTEAVVSYINGMVHGNPKVGILCTEETKERYPIGLVKSIGSREDQGAIAAHLFSLLRAFDEEEVEAIYAESFSTKGLGAAIMNRLLKAAGQKKIQV